MGYTTDFNGRFELDRALDANHAAYLRQFAETRRMKRDEDEAATLPDPKREAVGLPVGPEGAYFVGGDGFAGQGRDSSILCFNTAPGQPDTNGATDWREAWDRKREMIRAGECQPGLWCQWVPSEDGQAIEWDGGEKFYEYEAWLRYIVENFLKPWGYVLNGQVTWSGEESDDMGVLIVEDNEVSTGKRDEVSA
jgi:hypothetical protein